MVPHRLLLLFMVLVAGCGTPLPPVANSGNARTALQSALDAWQKGETADSLQARSPAVHVNDPKWRGGERLLKYEIQTEQASGQSWKCQVMLTVQGASGPAQQQASYTIDTEPAIVIVRDVDWE